VWFICYYIGVEMYEPYYAPTAVGAGEEFQEESDEPSSSEDSDATRPRWCTVRRKNLKVTGNVMFFVLILFIIAC
jgi:hypothetical protein